MDKKVKDMLFATEKQLEGVIYEMFKEGKFNKLDIIEKTDAVKIYNMNLSVDEISDIIEVLDDMINEIVENSNEYKEFVRIIYKDKDLDVDLTPDIFMDMLEMFQMTADEILKELRDGIIDIVLNNKQLLKVSIDENKFGTLKHVVVLDLKRLQGEETISKCLINEDRSVMHYYFGLTFIRKK